MEDLLDKVQRFRTAKDYQKAIDLLDLAISITKKRKGPNFVKNLQYAELLKQNAECCSYVNEDNKSIELSEECVTIFKDFNQSPNVELLSLLGRSYFKVLDFKNSAKWLLQCLQLALEQQNVDFIVETQELLGACYYRLNNYKMSYKYFSTSIELQIAEGCHLKLSSSHQPLKLLISTCVHLKLEVPLAKYLKVQLDLMKEHKYSSIQEYSETLVGLFRAKMALSEFDDCCLEYINEVRSLLYKAEFKSFKLIEMACILHTEYKKYEEAIEILEYAKKDRSQAYICYTKMATIKAEHLNKFEEGLQNCHEALKLYQSKGGGQYEKFEKCMIFMTIGEIYFGQKNYHDSLKYFEKTIEETDKTSKASRNPFFNELQLSLLWINIAKTQCELDMTKTALSSIKKSWNYLRIVDDKKHPKVLSNILILKGRCYRKMGNHKKAIAFTNTAIQEAFVAYQYNDSSPTEPDWPLKMYTFHTFLAGCYKLANDMKCVDETYGTLMLAMCMNHKTSDELIQFINETKNASYLVDDQELFMSKLKHVVVHSPLILINTPPDFVPKLSLYLNSWAVSNLLKKSVY
jgi:tetratricopeptide (TPR) repeat protein